LRFRALIAIGITIGVGCLWSFAFAYLSVGYLNMATGFLASIIAGNGINFGIIYMARYVEARRDEGKSTEDAVLVGHLETYRATLAASLAAGIAYGSLAATDFRGFKHFGIIAGLGMALCWVATYLVLPAILVLGERFKPMYSDGEPAWRAKSAEPMAFPSRGHRVGSPRASRWWARCSASPAWCFPCATSLMIRWSTT
ncbi:MAG: MMPL family transporter, partial [Myxococcales bacterium]|nr:MMPL family transporter [Myxococcales bacterium]